MVDYEFDEASNKVVDDCMSLLGANATQTDLLHCITATHARTLSESFWGFSRNVLLVYSVSVVKQVAKALHGRPWKLLIGDQD